MSLPLVYKHARSGGTRPRQMHHAIVRVEPTMEVHESSQETHQSKEWPSQQHSTLRNCFFRQMNHGHIISNINVDPQLPSSAVLGL